MTPLPGKYFITVLLGAISPIALAATKEPEPLWAYGYLTPPALGDKPIPQAPPSRELRANEDPAAQTRLRRVAGSEATYSLVDIRDAHTAVDWFPTEHPAMPEVVRHGPASMGPLGKACALCHLASGQGRPENAPVSALPVAYFVQQLKAFKAGARASADPRKPNVPTMIALAQAMSDEEMKVAAEYFAALKWTPWVRVVETAFVPKSKIDNNLFLPISDEKTEPIVGRILEVPEDEEQSERLRNPHSGFVAYVPVGSIAKGEALSKAGAATLVPGENATGQQISCAACHGPDLMGVGDVPGIAGRSPSYLVRQIYDFQRGTRKGPLAVAMQPIVAHLTNDDMVALAAYLASLRSRPNPAP